MKKSRWWKIVGDLQRESDEQFIVVPMDAGVDAGQNPMIETHDLESFNEGSDLQEIDLDAEEINMLQPINQNDQVIEITPLDDGIDAEQNQPIETYDGSSDLQVFELNADGVIKDDIEVSDISPHNSKGSGLETPPASKIKILDVVIIQPPIYTGSQRVDEDRNSQHSEAYTGPGHVDSDIGPQYIEAYIEENTDPGSVEVDMSPQYNEADTGPQYIEPGISPQYIEAKTGPEPVEANMDPQHNEVGTDPQHIEANTSPDPVEIDIGLQHNNEADTSPQHIEVNTNPEPVEADIGPQHNEADTSPQHIEPGTGPQYIVDETRVQQHQEEMQARKRKGKENWSKNMNKAKRERGEAYTGRSKREDRGMEWTEKQARQVKPGCGRETCKAKNKKCSTIPEEKRQELFDFFWGKMTWAQRKVYIANMVSSAPVNTCTTGNVPSRRKATLSYTLKLENNIVPVCKKMFLDTFCLSEWSVRNWAQSTDSGMHPSPVFTPRPSRQNAEQHAGVISFFEKYPKLPSHYCRARSSKMYLESMARSISELYKEYHNIFCIQNNFKPACMKTFREHMTNTNLALFKPKKDQCDTCVSYSVGNVPEDVYQIHVLRKNLAREHMHSDTAQAGQLAGTTKVFTFDMQGVMLSPYLQASSLYFKTKLIVHNFTSFNNVTHEVECYVWHEAEGDVTANEFASCIIDLLTKNLTDTKVFILWSDGCTSQNRNQTLSNALLQFAYKNQVTIYHKYLEKGHTQMPCDSIHSLIERQKKNKAINVPADYVGIIKAARQKPMPYNVNYLNHTFFKKYTILDTVKSIRPGNKTGDPVVTDIRAIKYSPTPDIQYKLQFQDEWVSLPRRIVSTRLTACPDLMKNINEISLVERWC